MRSAWGGHFTDAFQIRIRPLLNCVGAQRRQTIGIGQRLIRMAGCCRSKFGNVNQFPRPIDFGMAGENLFGQRRAGSWRAHHEYRHVRDRQ